MMSIVNPSAVQLANPSGAAGTVNVADIDGGIKLASPVVPVNTDGNVVDFASEVTLSEVKAISENLLLAIQALDTSAIAGTVSVSNFTDGGITNAELRADPVNTVDLTLADVMNGIKTLTETNILFVSALLEKMPRLGANERLVIDASETTLAAVSTVSVLTTLVSLGATAINVTKATDGMPVQMSNAGAMHLYNNIIVS